MRSRFDQELSVLTTEITRMGALCEKAILTAAEDLAEGNRDSVRHVMPVTEEIAEKERDIESLCLRLLLQQQPVAHDLRLISAALKLITDMERIGIQSGDIAEIIGFLDGKTGRECGFIHQEAMETIGMVTGSVDAFVKRDVDLAEKIIAADDVVDELFAEVKTNLIQMLMKNPEEGGYALDLMMIAKYLERIGDHAVNIAKWVIFAETGRHDGGAA